MKTNHGLPQSPVGSDGTVANSSRRDLLGVCAGLVVASILPSLTSSIVSAESVFRPSPGLDENELPIAALGVYFFNRSPQQARELFEQACDAGNLPSQGPLNLEQVRSAREALTAPSRTQNELEKAEIVHVAGWLLTHSEIGVALLFGSLLAPDLLKGGEG